MVVDLDFDLFNEKVNKISNDSGTWKYRGKKPCIISFESPWDKNSIIQSKIVDCIALKYKAELCVYRINTEFEKELCRLLGVVNKPSIFLIPLKGFPQTNYMVPDEESLTELVRNLL